jgi:hypothetical protein
MEGAGLSKMLATLDYTASHLGRQQTSGNQIFEIN